MKPFCIAPWTISHATASGYRSACCVDRAKYPYATLGEWWNSTELRQLRLDMLAHNPPATCESCLKHFKAVPLHEAMNEAYADLVDTAVANTDSEGFYTRVPVQLEFKHHLCNFACRHCHPSSSTTIRSAYTSAGLSVPVLGPIYDGVTALSPEYDDIDYVTNKTRLLSWTGGEPFMNPLLLGTLSKLKANGNTDCRQHFSTNGCFKITPIVTSCFDLLKSFPVSITLSLDGIGETGAFLRDGFDQDVFEHHLAIFRQLGDNVTIKANVCLTNLSILKLHEVVAFCAREHIELRGQLFSHKPGHYLSYNLLQFEEARKAFDRALSEAGPESRPHVAKFFDMFARNYNAEFMEDIDYTTLDLARITTGRDHSYWTHVVYGYLNTRSD